MTDRTCGLSRAAFAFVAAMIALGAGGAPAQTVLPDEMPPEEILPELTPAPEDLPEPDGFAEDGGDSAEVAPVPGADPELELESLLDRLTNAGDEAESKRLEQLVLHALHRSGSATVDLLIRRANDAIQEKDYALALEYLDTIVELAPDFAEGWNKRATVYYMIDEYGRSIADLGRVLALQPRHFGALAGLGMIFQELEDKERALSAFRRALDIHPHFEEAQESVERLTPEVEGRGI